MPDNTFDRVRDLILAELMHRRGEIEQGSGTTWFEIRVHLRRSRLMATWTSECEIDEPAEYSLRALKKG